MVHLETERQWMAIYFNFKMPMNGRKRKWQ